MRTTQASFLSDVDSLRLACAAPQLQTLPLTVANSSANRQAALLRRGTYVVGFNLIEDYLRSSVARGLKDLTSGGISFAALPDKLQNAAVVDAIKNSVTHSIFDPAGRQAALQAAAIAVASTAGSGAYEIHPQAFLHQGSNVSENEISTALKSAGLSRSWELLDDILASAGGGGLTLKQRYKSCLQKRNAAAHSSQNVEITDLSELTDLATSLCAAFDIAYQAAVARLDGRAPTLTKELKGLTFRQVLPAGAGWSHRNKSGRAIKVQLNIDSALKAAVRTMPRPACAVAFDASSQVVDWAFEPT